MLTDPRVERVTPPEDAGAVAPDEQDVRFARLRRVSAETWFGLAIALASSVWVLTQIHPGLLVANTTPAGGDMGAHVWGPAYLRDHLIPHGRLTGWTPDWYAGFPAYHFYMVVPSLLILLLDLVLPYGVAFKLVTVAGVLSLPVCAWAMGRLARLPFPAPPLLAIATVPYLFDHAFTIYGGNIASTLAGEFTFSISLSLTLLYFGVLARGLRTGEHRALAAILLGLVALCHLIPLFFALAGTGVMLLVHMNRGRFRKHGWVTSASATVVPRLGVWARALCAVVVIALAWLVAPRLGLLLAAIGAFVVVRRIDGPRLRFVLSVLIVGGLLASFWAVPFVLRHGYMTDMGWEKLPTPGSGKSIWNYLLRNKQFDDLFAGMTSAVSFWWVIALAGIGALLSVFRRLRFGIFLTVLGLLCAVGFVYAPQSRLWNARLLPFWYLCLYLLAGLGIAQATRELSRLFALDPAKPLRSLRYAIAPIALAIVVIVVGLDLGRLPWGDNRAAASGGYDYRWLGMRSTSQSFVRSWAEWNYTGYERKPAYPEYYTVVQTMAKLGEVDGCGRVNWEYEKEHDRYGTPMALMLLPFWTNGCMKSMEGLYFESSATTPYHFLSAAALSYRPSNPQRDLPYPSMDLHLGVQQLQLLGVRYYMAISDQAKQAARSEPDLTFLASSGPWEIYRVADSALVQPLDQEPVVVRGVSKGGKAWQDVGVNFFQHPDAWSVPLAASGPSNWRRIDVGDPPPRDPVDPVHVSNMHEADDRISFDVDKPGSPVLVKASYFPNWQAHGARGPWRVTPNEMVVIPTSKHVELRYGQTPVDLGAWALTLLGLSGVIVLAVLGRARVSRQPADDDHDADSRFAVEDAEPEDDEARRGLTLVGASSRDGAPGP